MDWNTPRSSALAPSVSLNACFELAGSEACPRAQADPARSWRIKAKQEQDSWGLLNEWEQSLLLLVPEQLGILLLWGDGKPPRPV